MKKTFMAFFIFLVVFLLTGCSDSGINVDVEELSFNYEPAVEPVEFHWSSSDDPYLAELAEEYHLEEKVAEAPSDLEKVLLITDWVHGLWQHDGSNTPKKGDPISILKEVEEGQQFRCVEYSVVINGCLNALQIPSRIVGLKTNDVETRESGAGHVVVEAYLPDLNKWIMADGQWNVVPVLDGTPLNCVEFQNALANKEAGLELSSKGRNDKNGYYQWVAEYLYYFDAPLDNRFVGRDNPRKIMLVPEGAKYPKIFQRIMPINNMDYTNSYSTFYPEP
ncbi:MAG: transglutaminase-like domain-containing protein [Halanaerobium sp.]|nr:transglutaminase-like domain-containing protein [Halanaerobium sp.]